MSQKRHEPKRTEAKVPKGSERTTRPSNAPNAEAHQTQALRPRASASASDPLPPLSALPVLQQNSSIYAGGIPSILQSNVYPQERQERHAASYESTVSPLPSLASNVRSSDESRMSRSRDDPSLASAGHGQNVPSSQPSPASMTGSPLSALAATPRHQYSSRREHATPDPGRYASTAGSDVGSLTGSFRGISRQAAPEGQTLLPPALEQRQSSASTESTTPARTAGVSISPSTSHSSQGIMLRSTVGSMDTSAPVLHPAQAGYSQSSRSTQSQSSLSSDLQSSTALSQGHPNPALTTNISGGHFMTLETEQGPLSIPIDVQAASRTADEKRRRNAGASARFRARRKEKEQSSTRENDGLRRQIQDLAEDADFYRSERNYLAAALYERADRGRHFPRPLSPRQRRLMQPQSQETPSVSPTSEEKQATFEERGERSAEGSFTRRRLATEGYPPGPPQIAYGTSVPSGYHSTDPAAPTQAYPPSSSITLQQRTFEPPYPASTVPGLAPQYSQMLPRPPQGWPFQAPQDPPLR